MSQPDEKLRRAVADLLGTAPLPREGIVEGLVQRIVDLGAEADEIEARVDLLLQYDTSFTEVADGVIHVPSIAEGTSWTVRVDAEDAREGFVRTHPHLSPLSWWLVGDDVALVDRTGQVVGTLETDDLWLDGRDTDVLIGPDGWLDDLAGGWATVTVVDGTLCWSRCEAPPDPTEAQIEALRVGFDRAVQNESVEMFADDGPVDLRFAMGDDPIHQALAADRAAFLGAPIAPLPELYRTAGLIEQDGTIAEEGFNWAALRSWRNRNRLGFRYGLDGEQVDRLVLLLGAYHTVMQRGADALLSDDAKREQALLALVDMLDDGAIAKGFWGECADDDDAAAHIGQFADELDAHLDGFTPAGVAWLQARCLDLSGEAAAAVATLEAAVTADCDHGPALLELAGFAADGGDALTAYRLLQRIGVTEYDPDHEPDEAESLLGEVEEFALHRPRPVAKRNEPCPCGSGKKYKACHLGSERHELDDRAGWLYLKARRFLRRNDPGEVDALAEEMAEPIEQPSAYRKLLNSPVLADLALHEGGVFADFLAARNTLLPDDEALLAAQWALVDRGVFEVERAGGGRLELRNIGRGERITVTNVESSSRVRRGTVLLGRPLPVGDSYRSYSGFMEVPRALVADLQEAIDDGDAFVMAAVLGRLLRPPRLSNTDGEDLVFHTIRWRIPDPTAIDAALRAAGMDASEGEAEWRLSRDTKNMANATIAGLTSKDGELVGEVNSNERAAELRALIEAALPDAELVADDLRPLDEVMADFDPDEAPPRLDQNDPAVREVLERFILQQEQRWLDEEIPALGGSTPREAAADPIGRERLVQLLDSFPAPTPDNPGTFDPDRLRRALGL